MRNPVLVDCRRLLVWGNAVGRPRQYLSPHTRRLSPLQKLKPHWRPAGGKNKMVIFFLSRNGSGRSFCFAPLPCLRRPAQINVRLLPVPNTSQLPACTTDESMDSTVVSYSPTTISGKCRTEGLHVLQNSDVVTGN